MRLTEILEKVWKAIDKIENIDFDQDGEEIKEDLLGIHRKFLKKNGIMDEVTDCLQELQTVVDEYKDIEEELGIDLINDKERMIFIKAILKGYIYFKDRENKVHKGYIVGYEENFAFYKRKLIVAYGIELHFNRRDDLWIYDDEELMKNPYNHPLGERAYGSCLIKKENDLDFEHFGKTWALTKEELEMK